MFSFSNTQAQQANFEIAPQEYATLTEQALSHIIKLDFDAWAGMLADDVEFWFPDGDNNTRTKLLGKKAVIDWWKNWKATSGIKSMTMDEAVFLPVNALKATAGDKAVWIDILTGKEFDNQIIEIKSEAIETVLKTMLKELALKITN